MEQERAIFTREELAAAVRVPAVVEQDLKRIISDRLEQCGLYYRVFSRTKTAASMARKFEQKEYGEGGGRLQDLVGVRVNLYFDDDVKICRSILKETFELIEWSTSERSEEEFKPIKLNGVFRMPEYLKAEISPETWDMFIDDTFEVQIKTMFFEGWHEIEHDMRYKGEELWSGFGGFSRYFNSILATLELCDKSMVSLFEDLGHALYKAGRWSDMIRCHFRMRIDDANLYPEVEAYLDEDRGRIDNIAKQIYKTPRSQLMEVFLKRPRRIPINVNTIVALLNENFFQDPRLTAIFKAHDVYNDGREEDPFENRHYEMRPLAKHMVFQMVTELNGNRMKDEEVLPERIFAKAADLIWQWIKNRYGGLFRTMPAQLSWYRADVYGYHVQVEIEHARQLLRMHVRHTDLDVGGRIWYSEALLARGADDIVRLSACSGYAEPDKERGIPQGLRSSFFSFPGFYKAIVDNVGVVNGLECSGRRRIVKPEQAADLAAVIGSRERSFPLVLVVSERDENGLMDEGWLGQFRVSDFTRTVWRYAHVLTCYADEAGELLSLAGVPARTAKALPRLFIFWPDGAVDDYGPEDVENCSFGRHLEARGDARTYDIVKGGQAFYHRIVTELRDWNISAGIWEGFDLETMTQ